MAERPTTSEHYRPAAVYFRDSDALEYVRFDKPSVYRRVDQILTLILDMRDRAPIGFKLKGFRNFYIRSLAPSLTKDETRFLTVVTVLEKIMTELGDKTFDNEPVKEGYRVAAEIATEDQVTLPDTDIAA